MSCLDFAAEHLELLEIPGMTKKKQQQQTTDIDTEMLPSRNVLHQK